MASSQSPLSSLSKMILQSCTKSIWFLQINMFHSSLQPQGWIISHRICCWSSAAKKLPLRIKPLLSVESFISCSVCLHLWSLRILWFRCQSWDGSQKGLIHWAIIQKPAQKQCWALDCVHSGLCKLLHSHISDPLPHRLICVILATDWTTHSTGQPLTQLCVQASSELTVRSLSFPLKLFVTQLLHVFIDIRGGP